MLNGRAAFVSTRWSLVARAASPGAARAREALEELCRAYWWPLYAYLRKSGLDAHDAADTVQGLFADLIEKGRLAHADAQRGSFRRWLLSALKFHLSHEREHRRAAKRGGRVGVVAFDAAAADRRWEGLATWETDPERLFHRAWAVAVLERALSELERACQRDGKAELFAVLRPSLVGDPDTDDLRALGARLGMSAAAVKSASFRLRKAFGAAIRAEIAESLAGAEVLGTDVESELRALFAALSPPPSANP